MAFTVFHLGPGLLFGLAAYRYVNLPTTLVAALAVDARTALISLELFEGSLHGPLHTGIGATAVGLAVAGILYAVHPYTDSIMATIRLGQERNAQQYVLGGLLGALGGHLFFDALMHQDIAVFWPLAGNPLYGIVAPTDVYFIAAGCAFAAGPLLTWRIFR